MRAFGRAAMMLALLVAPVPLFAAGSLKGKVNYQGKPLEGAVVSLYASHEGGFRGKPVYESPPTGKDGAFEVAPAKGRYFLIARKIVNGKPQEPLPGDYYAYYGGNPIVVGEGETIHIGINCSPVVDLGPRRRPGGTGIRGKVLADGKPLDRARVTLYQVGETIFRGIGYAIRADRPGRGLLLQPGARLLLRPRAEARGGRPDGAARRRRLLRVRTREPRRRGEGRVFGRLHPPRLTSW